MPSTTCTSPALAAALVVAGAAAAVAEPVRCYARDYTDAHLARNPAQVVRSIRVALPADPVDKRIALWVSMADQGHVAGTPMAGATIRQELSCYRIGAEPVTCAVDCDGGHAILDFRPDGTLDLRATYLTIGDPEECGGSVSLIETRGVPVAYRLRPADLSVCAER